MFSHETTIILKETPTFILDKAVIESHTFVKACNEAYYNETTAGDAKNNLTIDYEDGERDGSNYHTLLKVIDNVTHNVCFVVMSGTYDSWNGTDMDYAHIHQVTKVVVTENRFVTI